MQPVAALDVAPAQEQDNRRIFELHDSICSDLAHPKRPEILNLLRLGELLVGEITERIGVSLANASQHLAVLRDTGYGYMWWSARAGDHHFNRAWGHGGNLVVLLDDLDMVIVTTANPLPGVWGGRGLGERRGDHRSGG